jgi:hypothetical protein
VSKEDEIDTMRRFKYAKQDGLCGVCRQPVPWMQFQLAHRIPQRKWCMARWGEEILHHHKNLVGVCGLECNAAAQLNPDGLEAALLSEEIKEEVCSGSALSEW